MYCVKPLNYKKHKKSYSYFFYRKLEKEIFFQYLILTQCSESSREKNQ